MPARPAVSVVSWAESLSRGAFFFYAIYMLVGASMPFHEDQAAADLATSNPLNQIIDTVVPFLSFLCLLQQRHKFIALVKREKYLTAFLTWSMFTILWSNLPFNSFKLWFRILGSTVVIVGFLLNVKSADEALQYFKKIFAVYLPISFLAIALVPAATQWEWPAWRGLANHKNTLGQICLVSTLIWGIAILYTPAIKRKKSDWLFLGASVLLLLGTKSSTSLTALLSVILIGSYGRMQRRIGAFASLVLVSMAVIVFPLIADTNVLQSATGAFGKDTTFTGRSDIWSAVIEESQLHPLLGCGLGAFWVATNPAVQQLWSTDVLSWQPNEAHEGYLDLLNETGLIGIGLLGLLLLSYFKRLSLLGPSHFWKWFIVGVLIVNLTESTLFRSGSFIGWIFIFAYLAFQIEQLNRPAMVSRQVAWKG